MQEEGGLTSLLERRVFLNFPGATILWAKKLSLDKCDKIPFKVSPSGRYYHGHGSHYQFHYPHWWHSIAIRSSLSRSLGKRAIFLYLWSDQVNRPIPQRTGDCLPAKDLYSSQSTFSSIAAGLEEPNLGLCNLIHSSLRLSKHRRRKKWLKRRL